MKLIDIEIVERSSGFWIVDGTDAEGPFATVKKANTWITENVKE